MPPLAAGIARQAAVEDQADAVTAGSTSPLPMSLSLRSGLGFPLNVDDNVFMWSAPFRMTGGVQPFLGLPLMIAGSLKWTHLETESRSSDLPGASSGVHIFGVGVGACCAVPVAGALSAYASVVGGSSMAGSLQRLGRRRCGHRLSCGPRVRPLVKR